MPFISEAYLRTISKDKRHHIDHEHVTLGFHPETHDMLAVPTVDRYAGTYVIGVQGVGKSGLLENLIAHDAQAGNAIIVIDPHGDLITHCLGQLPQHRMADTYLLDMEDETYPFGINLFSAGTSRSSVARTQAVDKIMHIFEVLWADVLAQQNLPRYVRAATIVFLDNPGATLVDMYAFLLDDLVRQRMLQHVTDPTVRQFWQMQYDELSDAERSRRVQPLITRLESLFMGRSLVRNIVGQRENTIDFRKAIEEKQIILVRLPIKTIKQDAELIGTIIMAQIHAAVFSFANVPEEKRPGVSLYVDEFQHFTTPDFSELFTEGRKFKVRLVIAHQYRNQLPDYLQDSTMTARTKICFQMKPDDAREMAHIFPPQEEAVQPEDIEAHPVNYLLTFGSNEPAVRQFIDTYLRPMQQYKHGGKVELGDHIDINLWSGTRVREIVVADPTPYLDNLLYETMRTGNPMLPIPYEVVIGFSRCGRGFYGHARTISHAELTQKLRYPSHLVVPDGTTRRWTRPPESSMEQMAHFLFHLRMTMRYLAEKPIGKKSAPSTTVVGQMLTQLPRRAAFARTGDTVGVIYTHNTPKAATPSDLRARTLAVQAHTRLTYCRSLDGKEDTAVAPAPSTQVDDTVDSKQPQEAVHSRWEEA